MPILEDQSPEATPGDHAALNLLKLENQCLKTKVTRLEAGTRA
jgi:hypothetical protein